VSDGGRGGETRRRSPAGSLDRRPKHRARFERDDDRYALLISARGLRARRAGVVGGESAATNDDPGSDSSFAEKKSRASNERRLTRAARRTTRRACTIAEYGVDFSPLRGCTPLLRPPLRTARDRATSAAGSRSRFPLGDPLINLIAIAQVDRKKARAEERARRILLRLSL